MKKSMIVIMIGMMVLTTGCESGISTETTRIQDKSKTEVTTQVDKVAVKKWNMDSDYMMKTIETLSKTPRKMGTKEEKIAYQYLKKELKELGYVTQSQKFPFKALSNQWFHLTEDSWFDFNFDKFDGESQNLIAVKKAEDNNKDVLVISAHYDSTSKSNGALDNASGVAVLMELARNLADIPTNKEIHFILFSAEENYYYGSRYYVNELSNEERNHIFLNINLDMIGGKGDDRTTILGTINGKKNEATELLNGTGFDIDRGGPSDYLSFARVGVPALSISEQVHPKKSGEADTIDGIDQVKLKMEADKICEGILEIVSEIK